MRKITRTTTILAMSVIMAILIPYVAMSATIYDLQNDWDHPNNPFNQWSFMQGSSILTQYPSTGSPFGVPYFGPSTGGFLPAWYKADDGDIYTHSVDGANGNPGLGESRVVWTSTNAGTIDITGSIWHALDHPDRSNDFTLILGTAILDSGTLSNGVAIPFSFSNKEVNPGDELMLEVKGTLGNPNGWGTTSGVSLTIAQTPVPLPGSLFLLGSGGSLLIAIRRRKRNTPPTSS